jgi:hypothetical protein
MFDGATSFNNDVSSWVKPTISDVRLYYTCNDNCFPSDADTTVFNNDRPPCFKMVAHIVIASHGIQNRQANRQANRPKCRQANRPKCRRRILLVYRPPSRQENLRRLLQTSQLVLQHESQVVNRVDDHRLRLLVDQRLSRAAFLVVNLRVLRLDDRRLRRLPHLRLLLLHSLLLLHPDLRLVCLL